MKSNATLLLFAGAWRFLNTTDYAANGTILPDWHSRYPSGLTEYTESGYITVILTANDTTESEKRPKDLTLPAKPGDSDVRWALIGKYSLAFGGPFTLDVRRAYGNDWSGVLTTGPFTTATLPSYIGLSSSSNYSFHEKGRTLHLLSDLEGGGIRDLWFEKLPERDVFVQS
ncbi:hypothetical protein E8E13_002472 [Curvularia kusanoi]|uniref:Lipocalin-like domain-containing protein n=1 Tax=Curvularia kusanoi TaxID=90978 RepID=A0A9P4W3H2_CURKU|nr:hypothetical protein E8E13_002472 [Curvularia kusanoi]